MHISFSNPIFLWFLFLVPILIFSHYYFIKNSRSKALIFSNYKALQRMAKKNLLTSNFTHLVLRCIIVVALITGASGATLWVIGDKSDVNVIFLLDSSASMTSEDVGESRFDTAKSIASRIVNNMPRGGEYALISFAGASIIEQGFTDERTDFLLALERTQIARIGGTDLGGAIVTATNLFEVRPDEGKMLIVLSDGLDNVGSFISGSAMETIRYARDNQVIIHPVAIGGEDGPLGFLPEYYDISIMFDDELLIAMSEETGGSYHRVESLADVDEVISRMDFQYSKGHINYNLYYWAFLVVFLLLLVEWVIANTIYRRVL